MGIFRKIGDGVKDGVQETKFKADQFMRIQQVQSEIRTLDHEIVMVRDQIGQAAFMLFKNGTLTQEELKDFCQKIYDNSEIIAQKLKQIENIRAEKFLNTTPLPAQPAIGIFCPNCGQNLPVGAEFCANCGQKLIEQKPPDNSST